jgi:hypothetical protein
MREPSGGSSYEGVGLRVEDVPGKMEKGRRAWVSYRKGEGAGVCCGLRNRRRGAVGRLRIWPMAHI